MGEEAVQEMRVLGEVFAHAFAFVDTMLLKFAVQLGLPDIVQDNTQHNPEGITLSQLAKSLPFDPINIENLGRIMRCLIHLGLFAKSTNSQGYDLFKPTKASEFLLKDSKKSILPLIRPVMEEWAISPWHCLDVALDGKNKKNITPFEKKHGCKLWEAFSQQPMIGKMFYDAMAADTLALIPGVIKVCGESFQRIGSFLDVGGATGVAAAIIAATFPHVRCSVLDRPDVVARIVNCPNVECVAGDMFTSIPPSDAVLLKKILHDWGDEECGKILGRCKEALPKDRGILIIVESVIDHEMDDDDDGWGRVKLATDMGMMVFTGGKERTSEEWKQLLATAGFQIHRITPIIASQCVIEAHPLP